MHMYKHTHTRICLIIVSALVEFFSVLLKVVHCICLAVVGIIFVPCFLDPERLVFFGR